MKFGVQLPTGPPRMEHQGSSAKLEIAIRVTVEAEQPVVTMSAATIV
jgi:hypothetical protein